MSLTTKSGYNLHPPTSFSIGTMSNINVTLFNGSNYLPELMTNEGESLFISFCTCISEFMDDKVNFASLLAFTAPPDSIPQPHAIPFNGGKEVNEVQWYTLAYHSIV
jgi:hypothetical protein